ncbi:unnamed protein product, partial [Anisakis simplex]
MLWLFDLLSLVLIVVRVVRHYDLFGVERRDSDSNNTSMGLYNHFPSVFPLDKRGSSLSA